MISASWKYSTIVIDYHNPLAWAPIITYPQITFHFTTPQIFQNCFSFLSFFSFFFWLATKICMILVENALLVWPLGPNNLELLVMDFLWIAPGSNKLLLFGKLTTDKCDMKKMCKSNSDGKSMMNLFTQVTLNLWLWIDFEKRNLNFEG